ncbi:RNA polymerase sigma factor [Mycobacterium tuberculosis]|nr:RNA polymerase sigma factor [Mycobacterium tuberculosis]
MNDHLLVEALREREPGATAAVYDAHARRLYAYCWFRLRCRDAAQVALRDAFIVAEAHIGELRDPGRFRPWLYAIARQECERRLPPRLKAPDVPVATHDQEDVDQRITAWHAVLALRPVSREILELRIRRRLSVPDLAAVLGLSLKDVQQALDVAHGELEEALTAEILAQQGPYGCTQRAILLRERSGERAHVLSRRLTEHTDECSVCGAFRPRTVSARKVYGLLPDPCPAAELRLRVMSCFLDPELVGYRLFVATRVTEFTPDGFPVQVEGAGRKIRSGGRRSWFGRPPEASLAAHESGMCTPIVRAAMVLAVVAFLSGGGVASMYGVLGPARKPAGTAGDPRPTAIPGVSQAPATKRPSATAPQGAGTLDAAPVSATFPLGARASSAPATALPAASPVPISEVEPGGAKGVLTVSPLFLDLAGGSDGSIEVHAEGGPVAWRAAVQGPIRVEPSSGQLQAGQTITARVHASRRPDERGRGTITFRPGSAQVCVTWRQDAPPRGGSPSPTPTDSAPQTPSTPPETQRPESPHPTPPGTQPPESPQPSPQPPSTPSPAPPSSSAPESAPSPAERSSGSTSPSVSPASTG